MQVSTEEAVKFGFILDENKKWLNHEDYRDSSSFDLEFSVVLTKDSETQKIISQTKIEDLRPQASAYLISKQYVRVPEGYVAYVFLKNRLGQRGLLALNTGIIDQGYFGPISTLVINLSKNPAAIPDISFPNDRTFFRVVFHQIGEQNDLLKFKAKSHDYDWYVGGCKKRLLDYPDNFLNTEDIEKRLDKEITKKTNDLSFIRLGFFLTFIAIIFTALPLLRDTIFASQFNLQGYSNQVTENRLRSENLTQDLNALQDEVMKLKISLHRGENNPNQKITNAKD